MNKMNILYVIPARGGSKGIPRKNIKLLAGKPLIYYSIDVARQLTSDENICISTDDDEIIAMIEAYGLKVPFKRPDYLASDTATSDDVLIHAIEFYENRGIKYDIIVLLQPTSPLRRSEHIKEAMSLYNKEVDVVVSVKTSHAASSLCVENEDGFIERLFDGLGTRRQDFSSFYEYNGAIYIINKNSFLLKKSISKLEKKVKYIMNEQDSIDVDTPLDWILLETMLSKLIYLEK